VLLQEEKTMLNWPTRKKLTDSPSEPAPSLVDQVVALRQQGLGTDAIAAQLGISPVTVMQSLRWGF
jgi:DNA-binding NarL/FixJ family response regulator